MTERSIVRLPPGAERPFGVFVNGVAQEEGRDFTVQGDALVFPRRLQKEGRLGYWRWLSMFLAIAGTYRQNDSVDVQYTVGGRRRVATALEIQRRDGPDERSREDAGGGP